MLLGLVVFILVVYNYPLKVGRTDTLFCEDVQKLRVSWRKAALIVLLAPRRCGVCVGRELHVFKSVLVNQSP